MSEPYAFLVHEVEKAGPQHLAHRVPEHLRHPRVDICRNGVRVDHPYALLEVLYEGPVPQLAFGKALLAADQLLLPFQYPLCHAVEGRGPLPYLVPCLHRHPDFVIPCRYLARAEGQRPQVPYYDPYEIKYERAYERGHQYDRTESVPFTFYDRGKDF